MSSIVTWLPWDPVSEWYKVAAASFLACALLTAVPLPSWVDIDARCVPTLGSPAASPAHARPAPGIATHADHASRRQCMRW